MERTSQAWKYFSKATVKIAVEALGRRDCNLLIAEIILKTLYKELESKNNILSTNLLTSLKCRINERRDINPFPAIVLA